MKRCTKCTNVKPVTEFTKDSTTRDGLENQCRDCKRSRERRWAAENREEVNTEARTWRSTHGDRIWAINAQQLARQRGFEIKELVDPVTVYVRDCGRCQLCTEPVDWRLDRKLHDMGATLDHVEPIHSLETVQLAHRRCNGGKGELAA